MGLPFTLEQLLHTFENYNIAIWPMQLVALILGLAAVYLAIRPNKRSDQRITAILAFFWLWTGIGYILLFGIFGVMLILSTIVLSGIPEPSRA